MSWVRKSENGWKLALRPLMLTVKVVVTWQPLQPSRLNSVRPAPLLLSIPRGGAALLRMKKAKLAMSSCTAVTPPAQLLFSLAKLSSTPGTSSSGQPLMTALVRRAVGAVLGGEIIDDRSRDRSWWW